MIYSIRNAFLKVSILDVGASILSMQYFSKGQWQETTLQYDNAKDYEDNNTYYLNSIIGPHSGRIKNGRYIVEGAETQLDRNDRGNHLHGSTTGFHTLVFNATTVAEDTLIMIADDEKNNCHVSVSFKLEGSGLIIDYEVLPNKAIVLNMTHHTYFNLSGEDTILKHRIQIPAERFCLLDSSGAPEKIVNVEGLFDMQSSVQLSDVMSQSHEQFEITGNIDHPFEVNQEPIRLESDLTKIGVAVSSNTQYVVVYTGNYLLGENRFKGTGPSITHQAVAIEPQQLPNDINLGLGVNQFYEAGQTYHQSIKYYFYDI